MLGCKIHACFEEINEVGKHFIRIQKFILQHNYLCSNFVHLKFNLIQQQQDYVRNWTIVLQLFYTIIIGMQNMPFNPKVHGTTFVVNLKFHNKTHFNNA